MLLCNVEMEGDGLAEDAKMAYQKTPLEYYPGAKAFVMVKGQPLDALDTRDINAFHNLRLADTRKTWRVETDYEIDSCGVGIRFRVPVFIDGDPEAKQSIFHFPNKGQAGYNTLEGVEGIGADSELLKIVMPNPDYKIAPAEVKASFAFLLAPFWQEFGRGPRFGVLNASGLTAHLLHVSDGDFSEAGTRSFDSSRLHLPEGASVGTIKELLYADGESVGDKAYSAWRSREGASGTTRDGAYQRVGVIGTQLGGTVDRVSVSFGFSEGYTESVDLVRQRVDRAFVAEKTLNRLRRVPELYAGQEELKREVRNLRRIVEADRYKPQSTKRKSLSHRSMNDITRSAIGGGIDVQTRVVVVPEGMTVKAGDVLWGNASGALEKDGQNFLGIAVHAIAGEEKKGNVNVAYAGKIPVNLTGKFKSGSMAYATPGSTTCSPELSLNSVPIGMYAHADKITDKDLAFVGLVHIGFGGKEDFRTLKVYDLVNIKDQDSTVKVTPGFVVCVDPLGGDEIVKHIKVDPLTDDPAPEFTVVGGDVLCVEVATTPKDVVQTAKIVIKKSDQPFNQNHAIPPIKPEDGLYHYKLVSFRNAEAGGVEVDEVFHCGGNIKHSFKINEVRNRASVVDSIGAEDFDVHHEWNKAFARHDFRKLWQHLGRGEPILIRQAGPQNDYEIIHVRIAERESDPQIRVVKKDNGKIVQIEGNDVNTRLVQVDCEGNKTTLLEWKDGLLITKPLSGVVEFTAGCGGSGSGGDMI